jgi:hypothetical protein
MDSSEFRRTAAEPTVGDDNSTIHCPRCGEDKPENQFHKGWGKRPCKACVSKEYAEADPVRHKAWLDRLQRLETAKELREVAKAAGLKKFFTGVPCRNGHIAERWVLNRQCIKCYGKAKLKLEGVKTYKGRPCKYGHDGERYVSSCICVACDKGPLAKARRKAHKQKNRKKNAQSSRNYYWKNRDSIRDCAKKKYAADPYPARIDAKSRIARRKGAEGTYNNKTSTIYLSNKRGSAQIA